MMAEFLFMHACVSTCAWMFLSGLIPVFSVFISKIMNNKEGNETLSIQKLPRVSHHMTMIHFCNIMITAVAQTSANYQVVIQYFLHHLCFLLIFKVEKPLHNKVGPASCLLENTFPGQINITELYKDTVSAGLCGERQHRSLYLVFYVVAALNKLGSDFDPVNVDSSACLLYV